MLDAFYARATAWLCVPGWERRLALIAFLLTLPSLAVGLVADDYVLREQVLEGGAFAAYRFNPLDPHAADAGLIENRAAGRAVWWADEHPRMSFFRPLASLSLWVDFASGAPVWWLHLENGLLYAVIVWLAIALYKQLGLTGAGLGWAAAFFALDGALAVSVGWISSRNTLLAACFGLACLLFHDRGRRMGRPLLLALACSCFSLALLSAELGLCTLGYLGAHAWFIDRATPLRRAFALSPYAVLTGAYLAHYVTAGYGSHATLGYLDVLGSPGAALLSFIESVPLWLASTATVPVASFPVFFPGSRLPVLVFSLVVLALLLPIVATRWKDLPNAWLLAIGALLSLVPLATAMPQDRLRFFVAFGVYGVLGPWIVNDFDARERLRRALARFVWRSHSVWLPLLFVPFMLSLAPLSGSTAAKVLDQELPRSTAPTAILLNPPLWTVPWYQPAIRAAHGEVSPPALALYAGTQALELQRVDDRSLELHAPRSWFTSPFERINHVPFHVGARIALAPFTVELREVDARGAPTRARFTFDRSLDDPGLTFWVWEGKKLAPWKPPPPGRRLQLPAASVL